MERPASSGWDTVQASRTGTPRKLLRRLADRLPVAHAGSGCHLGILAVVLALVPLAARDHVVTDAVRGGRAAESVVPDSRVLVMETEIPRVFIEESFVDRAPALVLTEETSDAPLQPMRLIPYEVRPGDTVNSIAAKFNVTPETIISVNGLENPDVIQPGQRLEIMPVPGVAHQVREGDTLVHIARRYGADIWELVQANALQPPYLLTVNQRLLVPGGKRPSSQDSDQRSSNGVAGAGGPPAAPRAVVPTPSPSPSSSSRGPTASPPLTKDQFIAAIAPAAQQSQRETRVPASVTLAQAILETYWGTSTLAREANNYFGIKAKERPGPAGIYWLNVWEHINGQDVIVREPFRAYNTIAESFVDHGRFFITNSRYATAMKYAGDPREFARQIHKAGYATDPGYSTKLIALMDQYNLYRYDVPAR